MPDSGRTGASPLGLSSSTLPVADQPCVSVCPWVAYLPTASVPVSLQEKKVKLKDPKKRGNRRMARNGKDGLGRIGRPTLINPGSLLAFRTGAELTPPPGLTAPGHRHTIPSRTESGMSSQPLQAGSQARHSSPGSQPSSHSSLSIPQSLPGSHVLGPLWVPPWAIARKLCQLLWLQESPLPSFTDGKIGPERGRILF